MLLQYMVNNRLLATLDQFKKLCSHKTQSYLFQEIEDFVECMDSNSFSPRVFAETFHRCQGETLSKLFFA
jgi:hypothetical protein